MTRPRASGFTDIRGGGKGDMETAVMDAEWAWLTLSDSKEGSASTCYIMSGLFNRFRILW